MTGNRNLTTEKIETPAYDKSVFMDVLLWKGRRNFAMKTYMNGLQGLVLSLRTKHTYHGVSLIGSGDLIWQSKPLRKARKMKRWSAMAMEEPSQTEVYCTHWKRCQSLCDVVHQEKDGGPNPETKNKHNNSRCTA